MEFTKEQIEHLADNYADGKSSSDVFKQAHKSDFIAGFNKAIKIFNDLNLACDCTCTDSCKYENCNKECKRFILESNDL